jgi:hypothetical protein
MDSCAVVRVSVAFWTWLLRRSAPVIPDVFIVREICDVLKLEFQKIRDNDIQFTRTSLQSSRFPTCNVFQSRIPQVFDLSVSRELVGAVIRPLECWGKTRRRLLKI